MARGKVGRALLGIVVIEASGVVVGIGEGGDEIPGERMVFEEHIHTATGAMTFRLPDAILDEGQVVVSLPIRFDA